LSITGCSRITSSRMSPNDRFLLLDHFLGLLDGGAMALGFELVIDERLEELERHLLGQSRHWWSLSFRADDDNRAAGVVHALAEKVSGGKRPLLALERVAEGLERDGLLVSAQKRGRGGRCRIARQRLPEAYAFRCAR